MTTIDGLKRMVLVGGLLAATVAGVSPAHAQDAGFRGRLWAGAVGRYVLKDNDPFTEPGFGTVELKVDGSALGLGGDGEFTFNKWIGVDGAVGYSRLTVLFTSTSGGVPEPRQKLSIIPLMASVNLHPVHTEAVDLWLGPQIAYVLFPNDLSYTVISKGTYTYTPTNVFSNKGFALGADINVKKSFLLNLAFRWQDADGDDTDHLTIDPTFVTIGITKKY